MEINPNSHQPTGSTSPASTLGNIQRPGEYLRQIRIAQKKEIEEIANVLNMPVKTLTALEQDDYKSLPEATFIKGYYRAYAKHLNADASAIIQRFDEIYTNDTGLLPNHALNNSPIKIMGKLSGSKSVRNRKWLKRIAIVAAIALLAWLAVVAVQNWTSSHKDDADVPKIKAPLQLHYAGLDERVNAGIPAFEEALKKAGIRYELYLYPGVNHAFHNDTSEARYNADAALHAWKRTLDFFEANLK